MERVFSCEFYEIFKVNFLQETPAAAASDIGMWQALYAEKMCQLLAEFLPMIKLSVQIVISLIDWLRLICLYEHTTEQQNQSIVGK